MMKRTENEESVIYEFISGANWITITAMKAGGGSIESNLREENPDEADIRYNDTIEGLESILLSLTCSLTVDLSNASEAIEVAIEGLANNY